MRLVLDTNVWLDLLHFDDAACAALRAALCSGHATAISDATCRDEWRRVLAYPALRLDAAQSAALCVQYDAFTTLVDAPAPPLPWPKLPRCSDPDDQKFLELACAGGASVLLTRDTALLSLASRIQRLGLFRICRPEGLAPS